MKEEDEIQRELRWLVRDLGSIRFRLWGVAARAPETTGRETAEEPSIRSVIECVVADSITPAVEDLERVLEGEKRER